MLISSFNFARYCDLNCLSFCAKKYMLPARGSFLSYYVYKTNSIIIIFSYENSLMKFILILFLNGLSCNLCIITRKVETGYGK